MAKGKVGDLIRVVDADFESSYSNGDVGVIVQAPLHTFWCWYSF